MDFVTIYHAELDRWATVPESSVPAFLGRGWEKRDAPVEAPPEDDQHDQHDDAPLTAASTQGSHDIKES